MRKLSILGTAIVSTLGVTFALPASAEPTPVTVRVLAQDAKFIGESMGSARVELRDVETGELLASGLTSGSTGSTPLIMESHPRQNVKSSEDSAKFDAVLDLEEPTLVELKVHGPLDRPYTQLTATQQRWIFPGEGLHEGDGWIIEMPGIAISPTLAIQSDTIEVNAFVELMCGCPITPDGRWDANEYEVVASLWSGGKIVSQSPLDFITSPGGYAGSLARPGSDGEYMLTILAQNTRTGNSGLARMTVVNTNSE